MQPQIKVILHKRTPKDPADTFHKFATRDPAPVQYLYVNRWALAAIGNPQAIEVAITAGAGNTKGEEPKDVAETTTRT